MSSLSEALSLQPMGTGESKGLADPRYEANTGMFGGWTAALMLKAVSDEPGREGTPSALTVHFLKRIAPGSEVIVSTRLMGSSRSLSFWQAELRLAADDQPAALATVLLASRRPSDTFTQPITPNAPAPDTMPVFQPPGAFGERMLLRPVHGHPPFDRNDTQSLTWIREKSGRAIDHCQLAYLADTYAPRVFFISAGPRTSSTTTLSVYFHATDAELHEIGDDYILSDVTGTRAEQSTVGSQARLWRRDGKLLATSEQLCWFR